MTSELKIQPSSLSAMWAGIETGTVSSFRVMEHSRENRMQVQNLAIVFGPTLMWSDVSTMNVAVSMCYQGQVVEFILQEYGQLFS